MEDQIQQWKAKLCDDTLPTSTMHCIARQITKIQNATTVNKTAAGMIDLLVFVCTHCNSLDHASIFKSWSTLIMATFDDVCLVNNDKNNCGCYTSICNRFPIEITLQLSEQQLAYMVWFEQLHNTIWPLKTQLNHLFPHKGELLLTTRLKDMYKRDRYYLAALTDEEYNVKQGVLLTTSEDKGLKIDKRGAGLRKRTCDLTASILYGPERSSQPTSNSEFKEVETEFNRYLHEGAVATIRKKHEDSTEWTQKEGQDSQETVAEIEQRIGRHPPSVVKAEQGKGWVKGGERRGSTEAAQTQQQQQRKTGEKHPSGR